MKNVFMVYLKFHFNWVSCVFICSIWQLYHFPVVWAGGHRAPYLDLAVLMIMLMICFLRAALPGLCCSLKSTFPFLILSLFPQMWKQRKRPALGHMSLKPVPLPAPAPARSSTETQGVPDSLSAPLRCLPPGGWTAGPHPPAARPDLDYCYFESRACASTSNLYLSHPDQFLERSSTSSAFDASVWLRKGETQP